MRNRGLVATIVIMSGVIITLLVVLLVVKMPSMLSILDFKDKLFDKQSVPIETRVIVQSTEPSKAIENINVNITTYNGYDDHVNIEYPVISGMTDRDLQEKINFKLRMNALSIIPLYPVSVGLQYVNINCEVKSIDSKYMTMVYTGVLRGSAQKTQPKPKETVARQSSSATHTDTSSVNDNDPYLHGFIDPLAGKDINLANGNQVQQPQTNTNGNSVMQVGAGSVPSYVTNGNSMPVANSQSYSSFGQNMGQVTFIPETSDSRYDSDLDSILGGKDVHTADKGPTVQEIVAPTSARGYFSSGGQTSTNSPTGPGMPGGSSSPVNVGGLPVVGYSSSQSGSANGTERIFYTNTINLERGTDVTIRDFEISLAALASYIKSSDAILINADEGKLSSIKSYIKKLSESALADELELSDFRNRDLKEWPKHFSYRDIDGTIYVTMKLSNKLGDYVLIKYNPY